MMIICALDTFNMQSFVFSHHLHPLFAKFKQVFQRSISLLMSLEPSIQQSFSVYYTQQLALACNISLFNNITGLGIFIFTHHFISDVIESFNGFPNLICFFMISTRWLYVFLPCRVKIILFFKYCNLTFRFLCHLIL